MFEKIVGFARECFAKSTETPADTSVFAGLDVAHENGVLGEVPYIEPLMKQIHGSGAVAADDYAIGEQTVMPQEWRPR